MLSVPNVPLSSNSLIQESKRWEFIFGETKLSSSILELAREWGLRQGRESSVVLKLVIIPGEALYCLWFLLSVCNSRVIRLNWSSCIKQKFTPLNHAASIYQTQSPNMLVVKLIKLGNFNSVIHSIKMLPPSLVTTQWHSVLWYIQAI